MLCIAQQILMLFVCVRACVHERVCINCVYLFLVFFERVGVATI